MRNFKIFLLCLFSMGTWISADAHINPNRKINRGNTNNNTTVNFRADCALATSAMDQKINNVRARLLGGGDCWWDLSTAKYIVPAVDPTSGQPEISSIFAGAVWIGGIDPGGNLKLACQDYRSSTNNDFWPGPLNPVDGTTDEDVCLDWDKMFKVLGTEIKEHLKLFNTAIETGGTYDPALIPAGVKGWPGRGNDFFFEIHGFDLPNTPQGLGSFEDQDLDGKYEPEEGDYPVIEIRGCNEPQFPDEMIFYIYNDNGGIHTTTGGDAIRMEIQVQAFAYSTNDQLNDMTFQRYKLINRAPEFIDSTFFAMWVDPDLGCHLDDYVGCDTAKSLMYVYNMDALDGEPGTDCGGTETYTSRIPILGVDYFRGPRAPKVFGMNGELLDPQPDQIPDTLIRLGMSSFTYFNNPGGFTGPDAMTDPGEPIEFYRYLTGGWKDGTRFTYGGSGYDLASTETIAYAFTDPPNNASGWSMYSESLQTGDRRTIQATGPFRLDPGARNELIIGVPWVPDIQSYPGPSMTELFAADELAQSLFDACFDITDGPDAPDVDWIELDQQIIGVLSNDESSLNFNEGYSERDLLAPPEAGDDTLYIFQGYKVFQLAGPEVTAGELDDLSKARVVFQSDINDTVSTIYNWLPIDNPNSSALIFMPDEKVVGNNEGLQHTFVLEEDQFGTTDRRLINHKKYYYVALAYAHNNWETFDPITGVGQKLPYLEGRLNVQTYTVIPRPINYQLLNAEYGDSPLVTRLSGVGAGENSLDMTDDMHDKILSGNFDGEISYKQGRAPIDVKIFNPLLAKDGEYILSFEDEDISDSEFGDSVFWKLTPLDDPDGVVYADRTIDQLNEQLLACFGFSITISQSDDIGDTENDQNGAIEQELDYADPTGDLWFGSIPDQSANVAQGFFNYVKTDELEKDFLLDPTMALSTFGPMVPYYMCDWEVPGAMPYITPAWVNTRNSLSRTSNMLQDCNNVDIVFTSDKSKWSRCVIVETATDFFTNPVYQIGLPTEGNATQFDVRQSPSVGREDSDGDGLPDPDGELDGDGNPLLGMGWFPGYAIDVETGQRLNVFFGENSVYDGSLFPEEFVGGARGRDMMFNPTSQFTVTPEGLPFSLYSFYAGGYHNVYVAETEYDSCAFLYSKFTSSEIQKAISLRQITYAGIPVLTPGTEMTSYADGLIPNDLTLKIRVDNPYNTETITANEYNGYPAYRFELSGVEAKDVTTDDEVNTALDYINITPNPYYAFSDYETSQFTSTVKITNLPAKCTVTIYTLDGKFIRQYKRDEAANLNNDRPFAGIKEDQITPDLEWDLNNSSGIPVASGVYLVHIDADGLGERTLKWFGVARQFDASGL